jgi:hypothetical protein
MSAGSSLLNLLLRSSIGELQPLDEEIIREAKKFIGINGVIGFSNYLRPKIKGGKVVFSQPSIRFYVLRKINKKQLVGGGIPEEIGGIPTDVIEIGGTVKSMVLTPKNLTGASSTQGYLCVYCTRYRPFPAGVSVGNAAVSIPSSGTLNYFYVDQNNVLYIASNSHVFNLLNLGSVGNPITQPGPLYGGQAPNDTIAELTWFVNIVPGQEYISDFAIAKVTNTNYEISVIGYGQLNNYLRSSSDYYNGMSIVLVGATTGVQQGTVFDTCATLSISYDQGPATLNCMMLVQSSTGSVMPGDSGSPVFTPSGSLAGILVGGTTSGNVWAVSPLYQALNMAAANGYNLTPVIPLLPTPPPKITQPTPVNLATALTVLATEALAASFASNMVKITVQRYVSGKGKT